MLENGLRGNVSAHQKYVYIVVLLSIHIVTFTEQAIYMNNYNNYIQMIIHVSTEIVQRVYIAIYIYVLLLCIIL